MGNCAAAVSRPDPATDKYAAHFHSNPAYHPAADIELHRDASHYFVDPNISHEHRNCIPDHICHPRLGAPH